MKGFIDRVNYIDNMLASIDGKRYSELTEKQIQFLKGEDKLHLPLFSTCTIELYSYFTKEEIEFCFYDLDLELGDFDAVAFRIFKKEQIELVFDGEATINEELLDTLPDCPEYHVKRPNVDKIKKAIC